MKHFLISILLLLAASMSFSQVISGVVFDQESGEPVEFASVFFNGTFAGTTTNEDGLFELDVTNFRSRALTISAVGYYSRLITEFIPEEMQEILLSPKIFEIQEVSVATKSLARKRKACMRIFKKEFLGLTRNARQCYIVNEQDIRFNYGSDKDTLKAFASEPLLIQNLSLGYDITYHLDRFEYEHNTKTMLYTGSIIFKRDLLEDEESMKKYEKRRIYAYTGSGKHFFRSLWAESLKDSGFSVKNFRTADELKSEQIILQDSQGRKFMVYTEDLLIKYFDDISYISFLEEKVRFERDGFFDPTAIIWTGKMSQQRIADFLPYEYTLPQ